MQKENLLNCLLFETNLILNSELNEKEFYAITKYLQENLTLLEIGNNVKLTPERIRQIIETGNNKILASITELILIKSKFQSLLQQNETLTKELLNLKNKFKKELAAENQLSLTFENAYTPINNLNFTVRAQKIFKELNIDFVEQLDSLTISKLNSTNKIGAKTIHEIITKANELGVKIK